MSKQKNIVLTGHLECAMAAAETAVRAILGSSIAFKHRDIRDVERGWFALSKEVKISGLVVAATSEDVSFAIDLYISEDDDRPTGWCPDAITFNSATFLELGGTDYRVWFSSGLDSLGRCSLPIVFIENEKNGRMGSAGFGCWQVGRPERPKSATSLNSNGSLTCNNRHRHGICRGGDLYT
ncbi:hypothetical protein FJY94_03220 [Candidatus Kaiserbacteria bacterium]|nr:hypothetical protein [Candidatus Kaiserbacteria bacterium]